MSEIKRVALTTLEPQKVSDKVNKKLCKTVRISVILPESNEDKCPEYNYKDQLAAVKRRQKSGKEVKEPNHVENGVDPFGEDDDGDVRRIALEMEAKYGTGMSATKKKRKGRKDDYADIGMGYDENDSFIDNTDGYDEIIPQNVTTLHGGFYINCGALEFKTDDEASSQVSSSSSESEDEEIRPQKKKRVLETTDESEEETAQDSQTEKKPKLIVKNSMQQAIKKKLFSQNKIQVKKRRLIDPLKKTVKELLREKREDLNMSIPETLFVVPEEENVEKDSLKENKKPMNITSVTDAIESVVKQVVEDSYGNNQNRQSLDVNKSVESTSVSKSSVVDISTTVEGDSSQDANQSEKRELVKLPENIPPDILEIVNKLKQAALDYKGEGKKKFFTDEVNSNLLSLERKCKVLGKSSRVRVYEHLAYYIKVRRETLVRRAKNLALEDEENRVKRLLGRLSNAIDSMMPGLVADYEKECQKVLQMKFATDCQNEENKNLKMPRRRFNWSDETKKLLRDIMLSKKKCFVLEGKQKDNLEELLVNFLRNTVLPLWPGGWMFLVNLKKVFNSMTETQTTKSLPGSAKNSHNSFKDNSLTATKHSNLTITPVGVKTNANKEDVTNQLTLTKVTNIETTNGSNSAEIGNGRDTPIEMTMANTELLKKMFDDIERNSREAAECKNSLPTNIIKDPEKIDYSGAKSINSEAEIKNSLSITPSVLKESEKIKFEKEYGNKKSLNLEPPQPIVVDAESPRYDTIEKPRYDSPKPIVKDTENTIYESSKPVVKDIHKPRYEQPKPVVKDIDKPRYETSKPIIIDIEEPGYEPTRPAFVDVIQPKPVVKEIEKPRYEHPKPIVKDVEKLRYEHPKPVVKEAEKPRYEHPKPVVKDVEKPRYEHPKPVIKDVEKSRYEHPKPVVVKEAEKPRYDHLKPVVKDVEKPRYEHLKPVVKEAEKPRYDHPKPPVKDVERPRYDHPKPVVKDIEKPRYDNPKPVVKDAEKPRYEHPKPVVKDVEKPRYEHPKPVVKDAEKPRYITYQKDYTRRSSTVERAKLKQSEVFKPYADKIEAPKSTQWSKERFIAHSEQALPTDYSKHRIEDRKTSTEANRHPWQQDSGSSKHRQDELNLSAESHKQNRYGDNSSSKHVRHSSNPAMSDSFKQLSDMLKMSSDKYGPIPDRNHSETSKHKSSSDAGVIVVNTLQKDDVRSLPKDDRSDLNAVIPKASHCQLLDFSNDARNKTKVEDNRSSYKFAKDMLKHEIKSPDLFTDKSMPNSSSFYPEPKKHKYQDYGSNQGFMASSTPKASKSDGDDIQKVMENLRALQKLSCSPVKNDSSTSSPVSVIAFNKNFSSSSSSKSSPGHGHGAQRSDSNSKNELINNFQDDFQKQFINSLSQMAANPNPNKPNYRCS